MSEEKNNSEQTASEKPLKGWYKGMASANPNGRPKMRHSALTIRGRLERWVKLQLTQKKLDELYTQLTAKDRATFLTECMAYSIAKPQAGSDADIRKCTPEQVDVLYDRVMEGIMKATG